MIPHKTEQPKIVIMRAQNAGKSSVIEELFALHVRADKLPAPTREFQFDPTRKWRFDFCWPDQRLAVEVEGGIHSGGRHTRGAGFEQDARKYLAATLAGWCVVRVTGKMVRDGSAIAAARELLRDRRHLK